MSFRIRPLNQTPSELDRVLDEILERNRDALVSSNGHLDALAERRLDAEIDAKRILLVATSPADDAEASGFLDAELDWPEPGQLVVRQLVVHRSQRHRGLGRKLVEAACASARTQSHPHELVAFVRRPAGPAALFWEALGLGSADGRTWRGPLLSSG